MVNISKKRIFVLILVFILLLNLGLVSGKVITGPKPKITINFDETVDVLSVVTILKNESGTEFELTQPEILNNNRTFIYYPLNYLPEGDYIIISYAKDIYGNIGEESTFYFSVQIPPLNFTLIEPRFGVARQQPFNVIIKTDRDAYCRYIINANASYNSMTSFTSTGGLIHKIIDFPTAATLYVGCNDTYGKIQDNSASFVLTVDFDNPHITSKQVDPSEVTETPETTLIVTTDEVTLCKYTDDNTAVYNSMTKFPGYDQNNFNTTHSILVTTPTDSGSYNFYVQCEDKSGRLSSKEQITYSVDLQQPLSITDHTKRFFSSTTVILNISTNKNALCYYSNDKSNLYQNYFGSITRKHTATIDVASVGSYTYYVICQKQGDATDTTTKTITFTVDTTPPEMIYVNITYPIADEPDKTYYRDRLSAKWLAIDNESNINLYSYEVYKYKTYSSDILIYSDNTTDTQKTVTDLELNDSEQYYFKVKAENIAGMWSSWLESDKITVDTSLSPETCSDGIQNGQESDIDCGGDCPEKCNINKTCNNNDENCKTGYCAPDGKCKYPSCNDGVKNGQESDIDCGKDCPEKCDVGSLCRNNDDCKTNYCDMSTGLCSNKVDKCSNEKLDPGESDVDCGGVCLKHDKKCGINKNCKNNEDCNSEWCENNKCEIKPADRDSDTILDEADNCPDTPNKDQADLDNDGQGDVCDSDIDNDRLPNTWEEKYNQDNNLNPNNADSDSNGIQDGDEDFDNDGLTNYEEYTYGTNPNNADTDGDGINDRTEIDKGTDPLSKESKPKSYFLLYIIIFIVIMGIGTGGYFGYKKYEEYRISKKEIPFLQPSYTQQRAIKPRIFESFMQKKPEKRLITRPLKKEKKEAEEKRRKLFETFGEKKPTQREQITKVQKKEEKSKDEIEKGYKKPYWIDLAKYKELDKIKDEKLKRDSFKELSKIYSKKLREKRMKEIFKELSKIGGRKKAK
jgi:hypothetical protein